MVPAGLIFNIVLEVRSALVVLMHKKDGFVPRIAAHFTPAVRSSEKIKHRDKDGLVRLNPPKSQSRSTVSTRILHVQYHSIGVASLVKPWRECTLGTREREDLLSSTTASDDVSVTGATVRLQRCPAQ